MTRRGPEVNAPYTRKLMDVARGATDALDSRFDGLHAEASEAVAYSANTLRGVRERYREAYAEALKRWQVLRDELDAIDRAPRDSRPRVIGVDRDPATSALAAEAGADDARLRALRGEVEVIGGDLGEYQSTLAKLDLAERTLSRTWLFLERGDGTLVTDGDSSPAGGAMAMRIVEAQEAERARLAQEIHDGPAQALTNAIFQADFVERVGDSDPAAMRDELRALRDLLRRELSNVRSFINQLSPPLLDELGLDGAIREAADHLRGLTDLTITTDLTAAADDLDDRQRTVVLRVAQEALQNVRKHAEAATVVVRTERVDDDWVIQIRDDGRGFDVGAAAARGRRNFGLQFMRERAELIGARLDVRSRPDGGTVVRLAIPPGDTTGAKEDG
jgi:two-component system sensor histidine kinase DegS